MLAEGLVSLGLPLVEVDVLGLESTQTAQGPIQVGQLSNHLHVQSQTPENGSHLVQILHLRDLDVLTDPIWAVDCHHCRFFWRFWACFFLTLVNNSKK